MYYYYTTLHRNTVHSLPLRRISLPECCSAILCYAMLCYAPRSPPAADASLPEHTSSQLCPRWLVFCICLRYLSLYLSSVFVFVFYRCLSDFESAVATQNLFRVCLLYLSSVFVFYICLLYLSSVFVICICIMYLYFADASLLLYFVFVFCICILYLSSVFVFVQTLGSLHNLDIPLCLFGIKTMPKLRTVHTLCIPLTYLYILSRPFV